jgi:hypothetical protein
MTVTVSIIKGSVRLYIMLVLLCSTRYTYTTMNSQVRTHLYVSFVKHHKYQVRAWHQYVWHVDVFTHWTLRLCRPYSGLVAASAAVCAFSYAHLHLPQCCNNH